MRKQWEKRDSEIAVSGGEEIIGWKPAVVASSTLW